MFPPKKSTPPPPPDKKSVKADVKSGKKDDKAAVKGLKAAGALFGKTPKDAPPPKPPPPVDPTKGLRESIKAKAIERLALQAASEV